MSREIVLVYRNICKRISSANAKLSLNIAKPKDDFFFDQLNEGHANELMRDHNHTAVLVQDEYLGSEWNAWLKRDISRFVLNECLSSVDDAIFKIKYDNSSCEAEVKSLPRMAWLKLCLLKEYPVLSEIVKALHRLPNELNGLACSQLKLLEASDMSTMLMHFPIGSSQPKRLDNRLGENDSGFRLTITYNVTSSNPHPFRSEGVVRYSFVDAVHQVERNIESKNDRLLIHRSTDVFNERLSTLDEYYTISFFVHGRDKT